MGDMNDDDKRTTVMHVRGVLRSHPVTRMMRDEAITDLATDIINRLDRQGWIAHSVETAERPPALDFDELTKTRLALYKLASGVMAHAGHCRPVDPDLVDACADVQRRLRRESE